MTPDIGSFRAERRRNRVLWSGFCLPQGSFEKDFSIGSRVINEVVLEEEFREVRMYGILGKSTPAIVTWHSTLPAYLEKNGHVAYRRDASKLV